MKNKKRKTKYKMPEFLPYALAQAAAWLIAVFVFRRRVLRNEIRNIKGGFVVIANHECALDFVNLIGLTLRRMTFVLSLSFYSTLPFKKIFDRLGVITKQQFQTELRDILRMKAVAAAGAPLVLYPAGLMCEDGVSTPVPRGTWSLFRMLDVDVYMARTTGTYHVMPKWSKKLRPGRTYMDVYRLFSREELHSLSDDEIRRRTDEALAFDAYEDQEKLKIAYRGCDNVEGLEHVVYQCPVCGRKYTIRAAGNTLSCDSCGFTAKADRFGLLHSNETDIRYISAWTSAILKKLKCELTDESSISLPCTVCTIDASRHCFQETGSGTVVLTAREISLKGSNNGGDLDICQSVSSFPTLPFSPGRYFEIQNGQEIYRCCPEEGKYVMEFINTLKLRHRAALEQSAVKKDGEKK